MYASFEKSIVQNDHKHETDTIVYLKCIKAREKQRQNKGTI